MSSNLLKSVFFMEVSSFEPSEFWVVGTCGDDVLCQPWLVLKKQVIYGYSWHSEILQNGTLLRFAELNLHWMDSANYKHLFK